MITFTPSRGMILMCDFDMASVPPEMRKVRRVVVVSLKAYNKRPSMQTPGKCVVVPLSASAPRMPQPSHVSIPEDRYASITLPVWAICEMVDHVSHTRLDRVSSGRRFLSDSINQDDMALIENALRHALGLDFR